MIFRKSALCISLFLMLLSLPWTVIAANIPARVYESGTDNTPVAVPGTQVEVYGGYLFKMLLSSAESGKGGEFILSNIPLGKDVLVRMTKPGYVAQSDVRNFSGGDVEKGVVLWIGSEARVSGLYQDLGVPLDAKKAQVYLEINNEVTGEGIEGIQLDASSGVVFDLGQGEYLVANADGNSLQVGIRKPGYSFDIEVVTVPVQAGVMTQSYVKLQSGGAIYSSGQALATKSACVSGFIRRLSDSVAIEGVTVNFTKRGAVWRPSVVTDANGFYQQCDFPAGKSVKVTPSKAPWKFKPKYKSVFVKKTGAAANFSGR